MYSVTLHLQHLQLYIYNYNIFWQVIMKTEFYWNSERLYAVKFLSLDSIDYLKKCNNSIHLMIGALQVKISLLHKEFTARVNMESSEQSRLHHLRIFRVDSVPTRIFYTHIYIIIIVVIIIIRNSITDFILEIFLQLPACKNCFQNSVLYTYSFTSSMLTFNTTRLNGPNNKMYKINIKNYPYLLPFRWHWNLSLGIRNASSV